LPHHCAIIDNEKLHWKHGKWKRENGKGSLFIAQGKCGRKGKTEGKTHKEGEWKYSNSIGRGKEVVTGGKKDDESFIIN
jgi:hypothetical protein